MSIDESAEQSAYDALSRIAKIPRPKERIRICWSIMKMAAKIIGMDIILGD